jgi:hypothetical protein
LQEVVKKYSDHSTSALHYEITKSSQHFDIPLE